MKGAIAIWFAVILVAGFVVPAYEGDIVSGEASLMLLPAYVIVAGLSAVGVRGTARTTQRAVLSALPALGMLAAATPLGLARNAALADERGEPIFLWLAVTVWASWAILVIVTALRYRANWSRFGGLGVSLLVALLGLFLFTTRID